MRIRTRTTLISLLSVCAALVLSGCGSDETVDPANPYAEEMLRAQSQATSDFEKEALKDGAVSREEYIEALDRYATCIRDKGAQVALVEASGIFVYEISGAVDFYDSVADGCDKGTKGLIEPLYVDILADPQKKGIDAAIAECMVAMGAVDSSFTAADFVELMEREEAEQANDPVSRRILDHPETGNCTQNPGYARMQADG